MTHLETLVKRLEQMSKTYAPAFDFTAEKWPIGDGAMLIETIELFINGCREQIRLLNNAKAAMANEDDLVDWMNQIIDTLEKATGALTELLDEARTLA
jgi:hypothetical protein